MSWTKIEFAVQMSCEGCVDSIKKRLEGVPQIRDFQIDLSKQAVVVETTLMTDEAKKIIESTGKKAVVKGFDGTKAAVAVLEAGNQNVQGVVRMIQTTPDVCVFDGTVDGLKPDKYKISIHECGDISNGCNSVGNVYDTGHLREDGSKVGLVGAVGADANGRAAFRIEDKAIRISDIIGRSLVIEEFGGKRVGCGIVARSAGLFENPKTICACDGVSIWDENNRKAKASL